MRLRSLLLALFIVVGSSSALAQSVYRLPQVANGENLIRTTFIFVNNGSVSAAVSLTLTRSNGQPMNLSIPGLPDTAVKAFNLPAGQTRLFTTDGQGPLAVGAARVDSSADIGVSAIFTILKSSGGVLTEAGIGASEPVTSFALAVDTTGPFNTGIAVQNTVVTRNRLTFQLFGANGQPGQTATRDLGLTEERQHLAVYVDELFPGLGDFRGRLVVSSEAPVAALTLRQGVSGSPLTTLPVIPLSSRQTSFNFAQFANGRSGNLGIKTQIVIFSLGLGGTVDLALTKSDGAAFPVALSGGSSSANQTLNLPANGALFLETSGTGDISVGAARVSSAVPIGISTIFSILDGQGRITVEAGVGDASPLTEFTLPVDLTSGLNTGVALFNPDASRTAEINITFFNEAGQPAAAVDYRIAPVSLVKLGQLARYVGGPGGLDPNLQNVKGQLAVRSNLPLAAVGLRQDTVTANLTTLPLVAGAYDATGGGPTSPDNLLPKTIEGVDLSANTTRNVQLDAGYKLSGTVALPSGYLPLGTLLAVDAAGKVYGGTLSVFGGAYSVVVPKGTFDLRICALAGSLDLPFEQAPAPQQFGLEGTFLGHNETGIRVTANTTRNITVPGVTTSNVAGILNGRNKVPAAAQNAMALGFLSRESRTQGLAQVNEQTGAFATKLAPGSYDVSLVFGESVDSDGDGTPDDFLQSSLIPKLGTATVGQGGLAGLTLTVPDLVEVSGKILQSQTNDFSESQAFAADLESYREDLPLQCLPFAGVGVSFSSAEANGDYEFLVARGRVYDFFAGVPATRIGLEDEGGVLAPLFGNLRRSFNANGTQDLPVPDFPAQVVLSGTVTGPTGLPLAGATVTASTWGGLDGAPDASFSASTETDAQGRYSLAVLKGVNYTIDVDPPAPTGGGFPLPFGNQKSR